MPVHELGHIVLYVRDLERSKRFYGDVLGWKMLGAPEGMPAAARRREERPSAATRSGVRSVRPSASATSTPCSSRVKASAALPPRRVMPGRADAPASIASPGSGSTRSRE